jgi:hypothetical protein
MTRAYSRIDVGNLLVWAHRSGKTVLMKKKKCLILLSAISYTKLRPRRVIEHQTAKISFSER